MKEFIEKLIERLEEETEYQYKKADEADICEETTVSNARFAMAKCYIHATEIVNQLAEEYNNDFCEWKIGEYGDSWKPNCCDDVYYLLGVRKFEFCPYCGKKIKVAPYQQKEGTK